MKKRTFRFDTRIVYGTATLGGFLVLTALAGFYAIGAMDDSYELTSTKTARKLVLAGGVDALSRAPLLLSPVRPFPVPPAPRARR